jgi:hypothetical protein
MLAKSYGYSTPFVMQDCPLVNLLVRATDAAVTDRMRDDLNKLRLGSTPLVALELLEGTESASIKEDYYFPLSEEASPSRKSAARAVLLPLAGHT